MTQPETPRPNARLPYAQIIAGVPTALGAIAFLIAGVSQLSGETPKVGYVGLLIGGLLALATLGIVRHQD
jgi:hypothetical protein